MGLFERIKNLFESAWQIQKSDVDIEVSEKSVSGENIIKPYTASFIVYGHTDSNYGADADNNRSIKAEFVDDIDIESVVDADGNEVLPTDTNYEKIVEKIQDIASSLEP